MANVVALVMAAGQSRRFGSDKRKAVLSNGLSLLETTLASIPAIYTHIYVAIRPSDEVESLGLSADVSIVRCSAAADGLGSSMSEAFKVIAQSSPDVTSIAVMLGDMPYVANATHALLMEQSEATVIVRPRVAGQLGHPVMIGKSYWSEVMGLSGDEGAKSVLKKGKVLCVDVDDAGALMDIDRRKDIEVPDKSDTP
jgi:molybdenum cofactor cytidylyltransferase